MTRYANDPLREWRVRHSKGSVVIGCVRNFTCPDHLNFGRFRKAPHPKTTVSSPTSTMLNLSNRTAHAMRAFQRLAAGMATAVPRIGDTKVPMSLLEKGA